MKILLIIIIITIINGQQVVVQNTNRIECKSEQERNATFYILNCTLINVNSKTDENIQPFSKTSVDIIPSSLDGGIKVGLNSEWKAPWQDIKPFFDFYKNFIWKSSRLTYIGEHTFKDLEKLEKLDLSSNRIYEINVNAFKKFDERCLHELDLSSNQFDSIPSYLFEIKSLQSIEVFKFNDNKIYRLNNRSFENLGKLNYLELNNCFIKEIDLNSFYNLKYLEHLSLNGNHLKSLNEASFKDLRLTHLFLNENLFICDCNLRWLLSYLKTLDMYRQTVILSTNIALKCAEPNSLKSKQNILDINPDSFMCDVQLQGYPELNKTDLKYEYGDEIVLKCEVYADPEPLIYWMYGNKRLEMMLNSDHNLKYQIIETKLSKSIKTNKTSELRIKNLQFNDIDTYTCIGEISGTTNRKQFQFNLKSLLQSTNFIENIFQNRYLTNSNILIIMIGVATVIFLFTIFLIICICCKCKRFRRGNDEDKEEDGGDHNLVNNDEFDSKLPNCIRYAQSCNKNNNRDCTITEALLNNSSSTINKHQQHQHHNNNPRYQILNEHNINDNNCYYDDLRMPHYDDVVYMPTTTTTGGGGGIMTMDDQINNDSNSLVYGQIHNKSQSQLIPIYGTLSTNNNNKYNGYYQPMTLLSSSATRIKSGGFPAPPPPPLKPKRTFEYSQTIMTDNINQQSRKQSNSSTTLDDEDLDLNDLKDFEDVTFDNLRKPTEQKRAKSIEDKNLLLLPKLIEPASTHNDNKLYEETEI